MRAVITVVRGVEGLSVYLNSFRIVGPKPWGGGQILLEAVVSTADMRRALGKRRAGLAVAEMKVRKP